MIQGRNNDEATKSLASIHSNIVMLGYNGLSGKIVRSAISYARHCSLYDMKCWNIKICVSSLVVYYTQSCISKPKTRLHKFFNDLTCTLGVGIKIMVD